MIPDKVKALFQFIEYLHSNIENFNKHNDLIKELEQLDKEKKQLKPRNNYKDKQQYDKVQAEIKKKFNLLQTNTASLIKAKAKELNVCNFDNEPNYSFNGIETDIHELKENFSKDDLPDIFKHKQQYIEYRTKTHKTFLSLEFFIDELDEITKSLFDYFKETEQNEFEAFETKAIPVNSIVEAIQGFKKGQTKFTLSNNFLLNTSTIQQQPKTDYWQDDAEEITLIAEYQKAVNKLVEGGDTGCFPMRFRMLPRVVLNENKYSLQRKKYLLKQMRLVLDEVKNTEIGRELFTDLYERIKPYADIFRFVFSETPLPPQPIVESPFSVLEWATIFYYADETKLLSESPLLKTRLEQFMSKHQINTTFDNFKTKYYEAKKRINKKNDYPINKLELIIPFLKENYKQTVTKVENDIIFLEENKPEY